MNEPARSESLDARAWWTLGVVVAVVLIAYLGFSAGMMSSSAEDARPAADASEVVSSEESDEASANRSPQDGSSRGVSPTSASKPGASTPGASTPGASTPGASTQGDSPASEPSFHPLDAQSLRDFGELGVLPGLLDDFSSVPDCDFDDALSTCQ